MKYLDEFRDPQLARVLFDEIAATVTRPWAIMEVCGGQTHSIIRNGIDQLLPDEIELIHGPGCPVCVTPLEMIDQALAIAARPDVIFCSFGDMLRVPGSRHDLFQVKARGGDVRVVYSPLDAVRVAEANPDREVVFFGVGFETTAPAERDGGRAGPPARPDQLLDARQPRAGAAGDRGDPQLAGQPGPGVPRRRPRVHGDGHLAVRPARRARSRCRSSSPASSRSTCSTASAACVLQLEAGEARLENAYARAVTRRGQPGRRRRC